MRRAVLALVLLAAPVSGCLDARGLVEPLDHARPSELAAGEDHLLATVPGPHGARAVVGGLVALESGWHLTGRGAPTPLPGAGPPADGHAGAYQLSWTDGTLHLSDGDTVHRLTPTTITETGPGGVRSFALAVPGLTTGDGWLLPPGQALVATTHGTDGTEVTLLGAATTLYGLTPHGDPLTGTLYLRDPHDRTVLSLEVRERHQATTASLAGPVLPALGLPAERLDLVLPTPDGDASVALAQTDGHLVVLDARTTGVLGTLGTAPMPGRPHAQDRTLRTGGWTLSWDPLTGVASARGPSQGWVAPLGEPQGLTVSHPVPTSAAGAPTVQVEPEGGPMDPAGPWVAGAYRIRLNGPVEATVSGPLWVESRQGVVDAVTVRGPGGSTLATLSCRGPGCVLETPGQRHPLPAGTLTLEGAWRQGRPTGAALTGPDGATLVRLQLYGEQGVQVAGPLAPTLSMLPGAVAEGDPQDLDRLTLLGPDGNTVLRATSGGQGAGGLSVAGIGVQAPPTRLSLSDDPLGNDRAAVRIETQEGTWTVELPKTPSTTVGQLAEPVSEHVVVESPLAPPKATLAVQAGPVARAEPGTVAPHHDLATRLAVDRGHGEDRGTLTLDGRRAAALRPAGLENDAVVHLGRVPAWLVPEAHDLTLDLQAHLERDLAPGLVQHYQVAVLPLTIDARGPAPPAVTHAGEGALTWPPVADAHRYEAQVRQAEGRWRALTANETEASGPAAVVGAWEARVRALDEVGNAGPWSAVVNWTVAQPEATPAGPPRLVLVAPPSEMVQGLVSIAWEPDPTVAVVELSVSTDRGASWTPVANASQPPLVWDSRMSPDGDHLLRLRSHGPGGSTTRLLPAVTVDNLDPVPASHDGAAPPEASPPRPVSPGAPLPKALAWGLAVVALVASLMLLRRGW